MHDHVQKLHCRLIRSALGLLTLPAATGTTGSKHLHQEVSQDRQQASPGKEGKAQLWLRWVEWLEGGDDPWDTPQGMQIID